MKKPEVFKCKFCGRRAKSLMGLLSHERHCPATKQAEPEPKKRGRPVKKEEKPKFTIPAPTFNPEPFPRLQFAVPPVLASFDPEQQMLREDNVSLFARVELLEKQNEKLQKYEKENQVLREILGGLLLEIVIHKNVTLIVHEENQKNGRLKSIGSDDEEEVEATQEILDQLNKVPEMPSSSPTVKEEAHGHEHHPF